MKHAPIRLGRDGVWESQPYLGTDRATGRRIRPLKRFPGADEAEAQSLADEWLSSVAPARAGVSRRLSSMLGDFVDGMEETGSAGNTVVSYREAATRISRFIGDMPFDRVTPSDVSAMLRGIMVSGSAKGGRLSPATTTQARAVLSSAYATWVSEGLVDANPVSPVPNPRASDVRDAVALAEGDYRRLWDALASQMSDGSVGPGNVVRRTVATAAWVALVTGMRVGEVCALVRSDVSVIRGDVTVSATVVERPALARQPRTKGRRSRVVPLVPSDVGVIVSHMVWREGWAPGFDGRGETPLLCSATGGLLRPSWLSAEFSSLAREIGLRRGTTFHTLRHTCASWMLASGENVRTVQEIMGHADVRTTLAIYGHLLPGASRQAVERADEVRRRVAGCASGAQEGWARGDPSEQLGTQERTRGTNNY